MSANTMQSKLSVSCHCGQFKASVLIDENPIPTRLICYCIDCQTYLGHLNQTEVQLDDKGGTDILQISPAQFNITAGEEYLGNLMLSPSGIYRWYTTCCQTPICNTPSKAEMPYVGLLVNNIRKITGANIDTKHPQSTNKSAGKNKPFNDENRQTHVHDFVGPVRFGVGAGDKHPISADWPVSKGFGFRGMFGTLRNMARWRLRGDHKRSIFIDSVSGKPLVEPTLLTVEQRQEARKRI
ncbi:MAG: hypothetical protein ACI9XK_005078 [Granulosicoccus sp.]|jgi:hypothetical protein